MRQSTELSLKRAEFQSAKRSLDEATQRFMKASYELAAVMNGEIESLLIEPVDDSRVRQPKGRTRELVLLAFSRGSLGRASFKDIHSTVNTLAGEHISEATLRQALYRMEKARELERYSGQWSRGFAK